MATLIKRLPIIKIYTKTDTFSPPVRREPKKRYQIIHRLNKPNNLEVNDFKNSKGVLNIAKND